MPQKESVFAHADIHFKKKAVHNRHVRISFGLLVASSLSFFSFAQSPPANPPASPPVAYEMATLPKNRVQAWEMLRAATGLQGESLQPFYMTFHYKSYDPYGKPKGDGTGEYVWGGKGRWYERFTEAGKDWSQVKTVQGYYAFQGQSEQLQYPASLILHEYLHPLGSNEGSIKVPAFFGKQSLGNNTLSCFSMAPETPPIGPTDIFRSEDVGSTDLTRACTVPDKPFLLFRQGSYNVFFEQSVAFQHRIVAKRIFIKDGTDAVVDIYLDILRTPNQNDLNRLEPPPTFVLLPGAHAGSTVASRLVRKIEPQYPPVSRQKQIQGTVRLSAVIGKDGRLKNVEVLHSPAPDLTYSAIGAVQQWVYSPYLVDGNPIEVSTEINVHFQLP